MWKHCGLSDAQNKLFDGAHRPKITNQQFMGLIPADSIIHHEPGKKTLGTNKVH